MVAVLDAIATNELAALHRAPSCQMEGLVDEGRTELRPADPAGAKADRTIEVRGAVISLAFRKAVGSARQTAHIG